METLVKADYVLYIIGSPNIRFCLLLPDCLLSPLSYTRRDKINIDISHSRDDEFLFSLTLQHYRGLFFLTFFFFIQPACFLFKGSILIILEAGLLKLALVEKKGFQFPDFHPASRIFRMMMSLLMNISN